MIKLKRLIGGFALALWLFAAGAGTAVSGDYFVLVANVDNEVTSINRVQAERMFLGKKRRWPDGKKASVIINENPEIYESFSHTVLRRSPHQFLNFRKKMLFRGQGMPPPTVKTDRDVIEFVAGHVGGLGYVDPEAVTLAVKIISISQ